MQIAHCQWNSGELSPGATFDWPGVSEEQLLQWANNIRGDRNPDISKCAFRMKLKLKTRCRVAELQQSPRQL